ncbi:hypothetical protein OPIT5_23075 [Opitutaceae bacterium TAV5]|nr:hypothetical protein OPIT5_23075 [Opitutaceae bacterium TAV5]
MKYLVSSAFPAVLPCPSFISRGAACIPRSETKSASANAGDHPASTTSGFTLVELLVVIAIIGILAAITIPTVARVRESANAAACLSNLRQTGFAFQLYLDDNKGQALKAYTSSTTKYWYHYLLGTASTNGTKYIDSQIIPRCRSYKGTGHLNAGGYGMSNFMVWYPSPAHRVDNEERFFSSRLQLPRDWPLFMDADAPIVYDLDDPIETAAADKRFAARHGGTANVLMADIHVEKVRYGDTRWRQGNLNSGSHYSK